MTTWSIYIIQTRLNTLYTGVTTDVERRFCEHNQAGSKAARYLKGKGPLVLVWHKTGLTKQLAMQLEYRIKRLPKKTKNQLIAHTLTLDEVFPELFA